MADWRILLHSGEYFYFEHPEDCSFNINDIAHALSNICRYGGHCPRFYSVAQHSVLVSNLVPPELALVGLLHDAAEAFIGDMTKPMKEMFPTYKQMELTLEHIIAEVFNLPFPLPPEIKLADAQMLVNEQRHLMKNADPWFGSMSLTPSPVPIIPISPPAAKMLFLERYYQLI